MDSFDWLYAAAARRKDVAHQRPAGKTHSERRSDSAEEDDIEISYIPRLRGIESLNFLVVDDVPASCKLLGSLLKELGAKSTRLFSAYSVREARLLLRRFSIDIVLSDLNLPYQSGIDLLRSMRNQPKTWVTPFILVTNCPEESSIAEAKELGALSVLAKPFSIASVTTELIRAAHSLK